MQIYKTVEGPLLVAGGFGYRIPSGWDDLIVRDDLPEFLAGFAGQSPSVAVDPGKPPGGLLPPIGSQEVWAAGVTYLRSREARKEESAAAGGGDFYQKVYDASRPELFMKASGFRVRGHGQPIRVRKDARWSVPEPELTLVISSGGRITGFTIGNDACSRDIEGENPLYLPQAKVYDGSCAIGPGILVTRRGLPPETRIEIEIRRGEPVFSGAVELGRMKRTPEELAAWLFRELSFPVGCLLMTGTGIVPPSDFTLMTGDLVRIRIEPIGVLENPVE